METVSVSNFLSGMRVGFDDLLAQLIGAQTTNVPAANIYLSTCTCMSIFYIFELIHPYTHIAHILLIVYNYIVVSFICCGCAPAFLLAD